MYNENSQQWGSSFEFNINPQEPITSPHIMTKVDGLYHKLDAFMMTGPHHHYPTQSYSYEASYLEPVEDLNAYQNFSRPSHINHYSDISDLGWTSNPNYSLSHGSYLEGHTDFIHHSALPPVPPQEPSLQDTLKMFMQSTMQFQQESQRNLQATQSTLQANTQAIAKLELQMGQLATSLNEREKEKFPSQAVANPKGQFESGASSHHEQAKAITTLRSGRTVDNNVGNPEIVELQGEEDETPIPNDNTSKSPEPPTSTFFRDEPVPAYIPRAPYPQRLTGSIRKGDNMHDIMELFKKVHINIPLLDAVKQVPAYAKFLKDLCTHKRKIQVSKKVFLTENVSSILKYNTPPKFKDPGCPTISCIIGEHTVGRALLDLGASVNLLPYHVYKQLGLGELKHTSLTLQLADRSVRVPRGIVEDVLVKVDKFLFPVDFVVLDTEPVANMTNQIPVILGRPFLATSNAVIHCRSGQLELSFGNLKVTLNVFHAENYPPDLEDVGSVQMIDSLVSDSFTKMTSTDPLEECLAHFGMDFNEDETIREINTLLDSVPLMDAPSNVAMVEPLHSVESTPDPPKEPPILDLKPLPSSLKYVFLGPSDSMPAIIAADLNSEQEEKLIGVLQEHKKALGWTIDDLKGISPAVCMHRIHMEENAKPSREMQLNPNMQEVVRAEVLKLLDAGIIYPISDSSWVSPVQVVPK